MDPRPLANGRRPLRPNPLKPRLAAGGCAFGTMTFEFFTSGYPAICREAGAEFILYDMEHSGVGFETMKAQFAFCRGLDLVPLVRVPSGDYHHVARALDIGAMGIMVPMVETAEQAQSDRRLHQISAGGPSRRRVRCRRSR